MFLRGVSLTSDDDADKDSRVPLKEGGNTGNNVGTYQGDAIRNITGRWGHAQMHGVVEAGAIKAISAGNSSSWEDSTTALHDLEFDASRVVPVGADNRPKNVSVNFIVKY
jgi:hypothetical protein